MTVNIFPCERRPFRGNLVRAVAGARDPALDRFERKRLTIARVEAGLIPNAQRFRVMIPLTLPLGGSLPLPQGGRGPG